MSVYDPTLMHIFSTFGSRSRVAIAKQMAQKYVSAQALKHTVRKNHSRWRCSRPSRTRCIVCRPGKATGCSLESNAELYQFSIRTVIEGTREPAAVRQSRQAPRSVLNLALVKCASASTRCTVSTLPYTRVQGVLIFSNSIK